MLPYRHSSLRSLLSLRFLSTSSSSSSAASFLSPKDFLDTNSPAHNVLTNNVQDNHPATLKLGIQLSKYGVNLTKLAHEGKLETVIGRENEIQQTIQVLARRRKNNPCLIGEPGVGKTSIVEGLANLISKGHVPESMKDKVIVSLDLASMLAGTKFRGEFEERLKGVMKEIEQAGDRIILFIDEIHCMVGAGGSEGAIDASNILKPSLARGHLKCLGTTTIDEYSRYIEKDAALARRFQPVYVSEPSEEQTTKILIGLKPKYEAHHKVIIHNDTIASAVKFSGRYYPAKRFPDKAIDLIDEAASRLRNKNESVPNRITVIDAQMEQIQEKMNESLLNSKDVSVKDELQLYNLQQERTKIFQAWKDQNQMVQLIFETQITIKKMKEDVKSLKRSTLQEKEELVKLVDSIRTSERTIQDLYHSLTCSNSDKASALLTKSTDLKEGFRNVLEVRDIAEVVSIDTGIPLDSILVKETTNSLTKMEEELKQQIVGQDNAINIISKCIRLSKAGLRFHDRPIGVFIFLGPTGVGKTELAKAVNSILFKDQPSASNILRIDMSEYMERFSVSRLIGAPPGYVGYDEGGVLTDAVRRRPYQLVLLDEFEKAHREVSNLLLQVFDEGRLTDSQGRVVDFRNTVIIMTSNLGSDILAKLSDDSEPEDETDPSEPKQTRHEVATKLVHQHFSPEFVNRLDDVIVFNSLTIDGIIKICSIQLKKVKQLLHDKEIGFHFSPQAAEQIALSGSNLKYGARPLKRLIQNELLSPLASRILNGEVRAGDELYISLEGESENFMRSILPAGTTVDPDLIKYFKLELSGDPELSEESSAAEAASKMKVSKRILEVVVRKKQMKMSSE